METRTYDLSADEQDIETFGRAVRYFRKNHTSVGVNVRGNEEFQKSDTIFELDIRKRRISTSFEKEESEERVKSHTEDELNETIFAVKV